MRDMARPPNCEAIRQKRYYGYNSIINFGIWKPFGFLLPRNEKKSDGQTKIKNNMQTLLDDDYNTPMALYCTYYNVQSSIIV